MKAPIKKKHHTYTGRWEGIPVAVPVVYVSAACGARSAPGSMGAASAGAGASAGSGGSGAGGGTNNG